MIYSVGIAWSMFGLIAVSFLLEKRIVDVERASIPKNLLIVFIGGPVLWAAAIIIFSLWLIDLVT